MLYPGSVVPLAMFYRKSFIDSLVANLSTAVKEGNNYTDEDIAFALYKDQLSGWGYFNSSQVDNVT